MLKFQKAAIVVLAILILAALAGHQISKSPQEQTTERRSVLY